MALDYADSFVLYQRAETRKKLVDFYSSSQEVIAGRPSSNACRTDHAVKGEV
jgi:hypothetical protein